MKKRILGLAPALCMIAYSLPTVALADSLTVVSNPLTGDNTNLPLLFVLMLISAVGLIVMGGFFVFKQLRKKKG